MIGAGSGCPLCGGQLPHLISDAATMQIIRWTGNEDGGDFLTLRKQFNRSKQDRTAAEIMRQLVIASEAPASTSRWNDHAEFHQASGSRTEPMMWNVISEDGDTIRTGAM